MGVREVIRRVEGVLDVLGLALMDVSVLVGDLKKFLGEMRCYVTVDMVRNVVPKGVLKALTFEDLGGYVVVRFKRSVKPEDFRVVAEALMAFEGEYVSVGEGGYFRVSKRR